MLTVERDDGADRTAATLRWVLSGFGALAGLVLWALIEVADNIEVPERPILVLITASGAFFASGFMMVGPLMLRRALAHAALVGAAAGLLIWLASLRFETLDQAFIDPYAFLAVMAVIALPVPFLIAQGGPGWRDYPALFEGSWSVVVRGAVAGLFTGAIWIVIALSDELLRLVGIGLIGAWAYVGAVPFMITGAGFGLALAVVHELRDLIQARLVVRLLRLLAPVVLVVSGVFLLAALVQGLSELFGSLSAASVLIAMGAAALTLLTLVVDREDAVAPSSPVLLWSARGLAVVLAMLGALAVWAVMLRVGQYGWTPDRLFAGLAALVVLAYGVLHGVAVLRGSGWMARIRSGNLGMALVMLAVSALWLTPVLDAERISARSVEARVLAGDARDPADVLLLQRWGKAGAGALERLRVAASEPGREDLAAWLEGAGSGEADGADAAERERLIAAIVPALALQPASATGLRDSLLMLMQPYELRDMAEVCPGTAPGGGAKCLLVVADLLPDLPGEEAVLAMDREGWASLDGLLLRDGLVSRQAMQTLDGRPLTDVEVRNLMAAWLAAPPPVAPVRLNQLGTGAQGVFLAP
ncbi:MAG: DUF4153 domain-containing protein [Hyphomonadaceae bacterium]|nr:DUF4153 domain-containing protein [Hyphomonadaceae bacterium]